MKKLLTAIGCMLALALSASTAQALTVGDSRYLGEVDPGTPTNPTDEVSYINFLRGMAAPSSQVDGIGTNDFFRSANTCLALTGNVSCNPAAVTAGSIKDDTDASNVIDASGFTWLYVKYGGESHVWYVAGLGTVTVPEHGLSHWSLYDPTVTPDGGATLGLLGLGMLGLGYLRRRKQ